MGFGKQTAVATPAALSKYLLYSQAAAGPNNIVVPTDIEIGGGTPMVRGMIKAGVSGAGAVEFTPRPDTLAFLLTGLLGKDTHTTVSSTELHTITYDTDPFATPYYTITHSPGGLWADQTQDCRITALGLSWRAANFLRATMGFQGGQVTKVAAITGTPDNGPQFITPTAEIELPTNTDLKVLSGSFMAGSAIPMDEQWIVGSYYPDAFDIVTRACSLSMVVKITDDDLYGKMMYDPAGTDAWVANLMKESAFKLIFKSDKMVGATAIPYSVTVKAHATEDNVVWSAQPIAVRSGRQVVMGITGVFLAPSDTSSPVTVEVVNDVLTAY